MKKKSRKLQNKGTGSFFDKFQAYLRIHAHALFSSLGRLVRNPFTSTMTIVVMAITISLATGFYLLVINLQQLTSNVEATNQISLFLKTTVSDKAGAHLADKISKNSNIEKVKLITKEQALDEFKTYSGFGEALTVLKKNPLPTVIQILPHNSLEDIHAIELLISELDRLPQVDFVQMDMQWVERLQSMMQIMQRAVFLLTVLLSCAVLFITGNTIRLELQNRRDEVLVAKLVGATHSFIQRPFLYTGFWQGLLSGCLALVLVTFMTVLLQNPVERLSVLYEGSFDLSYLGFVDTLLLLIIAAFLGVVGAWIVLRYQLKQIKPV